LNIHLNENDIGGEKCGNDEEEITMALLRKESSKNRCLIEKLSKPRLVAKWEETLSSFKKNLSSSLKRSNKKRKYKKEEGFTIDYEIPKRLRDLTTIKRSQSI